MRGRPVLRDGFVYLGTSRDKDDALGDPQYLDLKYANRHGFRVALIAGDDEFRDGTWQVKDLTTGQQQSVPEPELTPFIEGLLPVAH